MQHVRHLEGCIKRCQDGMNEVDAVVDEFGKCNVDDEKMLHLWQSIERSEVKLLHALAVCDTSVHSNYFRVMYLLSHGEEVLAQMQLAKERILRCFRSIAAKRERGVMTTSVPTNGINAAGLAAVDYLVRTAATILSELRDRGQHLVDNAVLLKKKLVYSLQGEGDVMMELHQKDKDQSGGMKLEYPLHIFPSFPEDVEKEKNGIAVLSDLREDYDVESWTSSWEESNAIWTDLQLMTTSLRNAFSAFACKHYFVAAYDFALVMKLLATKCYTVEELLMTVLSLEYRKEREFLLSHFIKTSELTDRAASPWAASILTKMHPNILPKDFFLARGNPMPPYFISLTFVSLVWNTAFCLWQKGCVKEAHQWLCEIDVERLFILAGAMEKGIEKESVNGVCGLMTRHRFTEYGERISLETRVGRSDPFEVAHVNEGGNLNEPREEYQESACLYPLLCRILCLRNLCAVLLLCTTPQDVLFLLLHFHSALQWQARCMLPQNDCVNSEEREFKRGQPHTDATAEVLTVAMLVVEYYLTQRAMVTMELSVSSGSSSPMEVDMAVHQVCDELICFLSSAKISGVEDLEQNGFPPNWHVRYDEESNVRNDDPENPLGPSWITVQVLGMTQAFASGFRSSNFYRRAFSAGEPNAMHRGAVGDGMKPAEKRSTWSSSLANSMQNTARFIMKSVGSSWERGEVTDTARKTSFLSSELRAILLLPQCFEVKEYLRAEKGPGVLCFPSLHGVGLPLLPEEELVDGSCKSSEDLAWRLLVIACRYSQSQSLVPLMPHNSTDDIDGLIEIVIPEINNSARMLISELNSHAGDEWLPVWKHERSLSAGRIRTSKLLAALERGTFMSVTRDDPRRDGADGGQHGERAAHPEKELLHDSMFTKNSIPPAADAMKNRENVLEEHKDEAEESTAQLWDAPAPIFTPPIHFDFSAFTSGSAEALHATRQIVDDLLRGQAAADDATVHSKEMTAESNTHHMSVLTPNSRQLLHEELPSIWQFMPWRLIYSSRHHGFSFNAMLSCSQREVDASQEHGRISPMLLVIELMTTNRREPTNDEDEATKLVIGACLSEPLHTGTRRFYGNSGTFVFQLLLSSTASQSASPQLRIYRATGKNQQFINTMSHSLAIGGGGGCSIFFNDTITHGSTAACATFDAPPLTHWSTSSSFFSWSSDVAVEGVTKDDLASSYDFDVCSLELLVIGN
ncbi:hypothetical protein MOQ_003293 [Trypanosoma cruzi marinkellei]|uniref:Oxidation resistance protein 1 n=1 Tax=Trypanosoma cruzi marinkellei TaxID=85056 RepID=K2NV39_TRYCR|nr:hypothetical protein MOQ_003293 [Trypanosoma cruzi marinkellei]